MRACVLTQKSEEAPASSASLLATPMQRPEPVLSVVWFFVLENVGTIVNAVVLSF